jgi:peptidoglycan/LPS O-acetylase OafA/YrhL
MMDGWDLISSRVGGRHLQGESGQASEIRALTSVRGLAALYVVAYHASDAAGVDYAPRGYLAVDLFFVLSGFVLALSAAEDFRVKGWPACGRFWARRLARILPLNVFVVAAIVAANMTAHRGAGAPLARVACNALALQGFGGCVTLNAPAWTLSFEWLAYAAFPVLLIILVFSRIGWCVFTVCIALLGLIGCAAGTGRMTLDSSQFGPGFSAVRCVGEMVLGLAAYRAYAAPSLRRLMSSDIAFAAIILVGSGECWLGECLRPAWIGGDVWVLAVFPALIITVAANKGSVAQCLGWRALHVLGVISFSVYLLHDAILQREARGMAILYPGWPAPGVISGLFVALATVSVIVPAWLVYRLVERPSRTALRRWLLPPTA